MSNSTIDSLDAHFYVVQDEFGKLSSIDPNALDNSNSENWISDDSSPKCLLCGSPFTMTRRRHHCRYCGLLFCGACTENRAMVGDQLSRICDSCAVMLIPPGTNAKFEGLRRWCEDNHCGELFDDSPKNAGIHFLVSKMQSSSPESHFNAIRTLYKLLPCHAPALIESKIPSALLKHSLECKSGNCHAQSLSLDLFVTLYNTDSKGCSVNFSDYHIDIPQLFDSKSIEMKRAAARFLYTLIQEQDVEIPNALQLLNVKDKWVVAFVLASLGKKKDLRDINVEEAIPILLKLIKKDHEAGTVAARFYASEVLNKISINNFEASSVLADNDLQAIVDLLYANSPKDQNDKRPETELAINLSSVLLNAWIAIAKKRKPDHSVPFSQVLMPLFEVIEKPNERKDDCQLGKVQMNFFKLIREFATFDDCLQSFKSEQIMNILSDFSLGDDEFSKEAYYTIQSLK
ncbi:hypothetical protein M9Y10_045427 [Tritrichomonas musculus]|uniref:FYVE-type domain-containing protein n=1 Tax=Tritrichomonas musculus TaxID=1915356 RepID=A0ABR2JWH7_9EUKA